MKWAARLACVAVAAAVLAGCAGDQSVLDPRGPGAARIAHLTWLLFALGAGVLLIVMIATWLAVRGSARSRRWLGGTGAVVGGGIVFPSLTLTALLGYGTWLSEAGIRDLARAQALRIDVVGEQWWWRITYATPEGQRVATANELRIPAGQTVELALTSADVIHSFWVPNLGGKVDMTPGRTTYLRVRADQQGVLRGQCAEYCGGPHALMALEVVALPPEEFTAWLKAQAAPAAAPASQIAERGRELFHAAGCGACHAIRGTEAAGTVGPDLTHLGDRRSIAAATLPRTRTNLALFIADGQHIKPANRMPPFRIFTGEELAAMATYLEDLR
jgi:cytochrome c oxidase subunit II